MAKVALSTHQRGLRPAHDCWSPQTTEVWVAAALILLSWLIATVHPRTLKLNVYTECNDQFDACCHASTGRIFMYMVLSYVRAQNSSPEA